MEKPDMGATLLVPLVAVCMALQVITLICLGVSQRNMTRRIEDVAARPITVAGNSSSCNYPWSASYGYAGQQISVDPGYYRDDQVMGIVEFTLATKIPGSRVMLRYRLNDGSKWRQIALKQGEPMRYSARLPMKIADKIEYQMLQVVGNEIVQASEVIPAEMATWMGGNGDVSIYLRQQDGGKLSVEFQNNGALIEALQVAEVRLKVNRAKPEEIVLKEDPWACTFSSEGFPGTSVTVTVTYRDGAVRTVTFIPGLQDPPVIKR